jgi:hypothetical protein
VYPIEQTPYVLKIARQDEYGIKHQFDVSAWQTEYPGGVIGIAVTRPGETEDDAMPATTTIVGSTMEWTVNAWETELPGHSTAEARLLGEDEDGNDVKLKSALIRIFIEPSIADGLPTDPLMPFIDQVIVYAGIANSNATLSTEEADRANAQRLLAEEANRLAGLSEVAARGFASDAEGAKDIAVESAGTADARATESENARNVSVGARDLAKQYRDTAQAYANTASQASGVALSSRDAAIGYVNTFTPAETARAQAEAIRQSNENTRVGAESVRDVAETSRQNARIKSAHAYGDDLVFVKQDNTNLVVADALKSVNDAAQSSIDAEIVSGSANGNNLVFTRSDSATITVTDALKPMTDIVGDVGVELAKLQGIAFAINADGELEVNL